MLNRLLQTSQLSAALCIFVCVAIGLPQHLAAQPSTNGGAPAETSELAQLKPSRSLSATPIDESLFIVYYMHWIYLDWPDPSRHDFAFVDQVGSCRARIHLCKSRANAVGAVELQILADQAELMLDMYVDFIESKDLIAAAASADAERQADSTMIGIAIAHSSSIATKAGPLGTALAVLAELVAGAIESRQLQEAERIILEKEQNRVVNEFESRWNYFQIVVAKLQVKHSWAAADVDFSSGANRKSDPFAILANSIGGDATECVDACVRAAQLVPDESHYNLLRAQILQRGSEWAAQASQEQWVRQKFTYGSDIANLGVQVCRVRLQFGDDHLDRGRYNLARCLHFAGLQADAVENAWQAKGQFGNSDFAYEFSCMLSVNGMNHTAMEWLRWSFKCGFDELRRCRTDPRLKGLRLELPVAFEEATTVKYCDSIEWHTFRDDYKITNLSCFPITNVRVQPAITMLDRDRMPVFLGGADGNQPALTCARIEPGQTVVWKRVFSVNRQNFVKIVPANFVCDQDPRVQDLFGVPVW